MGPPETRNPVPPLPASDQGNGVKTSPKGQLRQCISTALKGYRALRYAALSEARSVLLPEALRMLQADPSRAYPGDVFRTIDCMTKRRSYFVRLHHNREFNAASYSGLVTCGSVWACPVCAAKIQERRRAEIQQGIDAMTGRGFVAVMVTLTFPHYAFQTLADLLTRQADAFRRLRKGKAWDALKSSTGFAGLIRSLEVVHGANGWHPHTHEIWFLRAGVDPLDLRSRIVRLWASACQRAGLLEGSTPAQEPAFYAHAVDVRAEVTASDYLAKQDDSRTWGMADEVARATSKNGRAKGVHPHHFLVRRAPGDALRYIEYCKAMKSRRQVFWSPGLKALCGVGEVSDEVLADQPEVGAELLALIPAPAWRVVIANDARCELLDAAEVGGFDAVTALLRSIGVGPSDLPLTPRELIDES